jgi:hypothetical protein
MARRVYREADMVPSIHLGASADPDEFAAAELLLAWTGRLSCRAGRRRRGERLRRRSLR